MPDCRISATKAIISKLIHRLELESNRESLEIYRQLLELVVHKTPEGRCYRAQGEDTRKRRGDSLHGVGIITRNHPGFCGQ
jgi:hypothetical protein